MPDLDAPISILGFGRFGRALAELVVEHNLAARAYDSGTAGLQPDLGRAGLRPAASVTITNSIPELTDGARLIILATPVSAAESVLRELRPHLTADHLVIDVASVKAGAVAAMTDILGTDIPWIATHPLFGPASIARAEHLRAVVCPNDTHPAAAARAAEFYEHLGCNVTLQPADEHDRTMAYTHALAFFVAKGMLEVGAGQSDAPAPPSFNAMAQTIDTVRADAGHLFYAIQHDNPHAAEARQALLDALARLHDQIATTPTPTPPITPTSGTSAEPTPPVGGDQPLSITPAADEPDLTRTADLLREIDDQIADLSARRAQIAERAARFKRTT